jgi:hypothetical protein
MLQKTLIWQFSQSGFLLKRCLLQFLGATTNNSICQENNSELAIKTNEKLCSVRNNSKSFLLSRKKIIICKSKKKKHILPYFQK